MDRKRSSRRARLILRHGWSTISPYISVGIAGGIAACLGGFSVGKIASFLTYATQFAKPINEIAGVTTQIQSALASAERIAEILAEDSEAADPEATIRISIPEHIRGGVTFENVSFSYEPERPLIRSMNIDVLPNQVVAIVGPTGAGKTTLVNLLMRFYDVTGGSIKIDGTEISSVKRSSVRRQFSMVLQDTWLFRGTVRENIAYAREDAGEKKSLRRQRPLTRITLSSVFRTATTRSFPVRAICLPDSSSSLRSRGQCFWTLPC